MGKAVCMSQAISEIDPTIEVIRVEDRFRPRQEIGNAVFCCVDSITARISDLEIGEGRVRRSGLTAECWAKCCEFSPSPTATSSSPLRFNLVRCIRSPARNLHVTQHDLRRQHRSGNDGSPVHTLAPRHPNRRRHQRQSAVRRMDRPRHSVTKRTGHELSPRHPAPHVFVRR